MPSLRHYYSDAIIGPHNQVLAREQYTGLPVAHIRLGCGPEQRLLSDTERLQDVHGASGCPVVEVRFWYPSARGPKELLAQCKTFLIVGKSAWHWPLREIS